MFDTLTWAEAVAYVCLAAITVAATVWDLKTRKIPNALTVGALACGLAWQGYFHGGTGLLTALGGFAIGFGTFFVLWMTGGGGGGDVKLMGALGAWLGFQATLYVLLLSALLVLGITIVSKAIAPRTESATLAKEKQPAGVALALPVTIAVWSLIVIDKVYTARDLYPM